MAVVYIALFAIAIGVATFVENDFGTSAAQKWIYKSTWFEVLLILFSGSLIQNVITYRLIPRKMWAVLIFHLSIIVILLGAGITRYSGFEGMMHIREGSTVNQFYSSDNYLNLDFYGFTSTPVHTNESVLFSSLGDNSFAKSYKVGSEEVKVELLDFIANPSEEVLADENGNSAVQVVMGGSGGRMESWLMKDEVRRINGIEFSAEDSYVADVNLQEKEGVWYFRSNDVYSVRVMATGQVDTLTPGQSSPLMTRALYQNLSRGTSPFVFAKTETSIRRQLTSASQKIESSSKVALVLRVSTSNAISEQTIVAQGGWVNEPVLFDLGQSRVEISYGSRIYTLPFALKLHKFEMERYPGTNSPMEYASEVQIIDEAKGVNEPFRIFMNHILNYNGYRFFQSSYDRDEQGTFLSVNHDALGTWFSYLGYILLTIGMFWTLFTKQSRFYELSQKVRRKSAVILLLISSTLFSSHASAQATETIYPAPSIEHAESFSRLLVQDVRGRVKPMHTLTREVMRKVYGKESFEGLSADAVLLGAFTSPREWYSAPLIKLGKVESIGQWIGVTGKYAAYKDFFNTDGSYKLADKIQEANSIAPKDKGTLEKALIQIDERVNIMNMVFAGALFKMVPLVNDENHTWVGIRQHGEDARSEVADRFFPAYRQTLEDAISSGDYQWSNALITELDNFQRKYGADVAPSEGKRNAEIWLNAWTPFNKLALVYTLLGIGFLVVLFVHVFRPNASVKWGMHILVGLMVLAFALHTTGLGIRWFVSGRAPWSNGYESMIYIGWTTTLAGLIFSRKSSGGLAATNVLGGVVLLIAMLSYLNPEITPLVPVLRSYWLTIHVSLEAGSYGFLMLGAVMGLINLTMMLFLNKGNVKRIRPLIQELTHRSEMTLIGGLFMLSVGTYLGGVWANESWGRYWGWDAKETWALVSILVYAFILHMRMVPKLRGLYAFNVATLFGLASIVMTYFGVNYYLSGLHSYAAGDPVPIPTWVYYTVASFTVLSLVAWRRSKTAGLSGKLK